MTYTGEEKPKAPQGKAILTVPLNTHYPHSLRFKNKSLVLISFPLYFAALRKNILCQFCNSKAIACDLGLPAPSAPSHSGAAGEDPCLCSLTQLCSGERPPPLPPLAVVLLARTSSHIIVIWGGFWFRKPKSNGLCIF